MLRLVVSLASFISTASAMVIALTVVIGVALPKSDQLLFSSAPSWRPGPWEVFVMDVGRQIAHRVADNRTAGNPGLPVEWSPDGQQIAFISDMGGNGYHLYVMDADGGGARPLTRIRPVDTGWEIGWSPDGDKIAFMSNLERGWDIYLMDVPDENASGDIPYPIRLTISSGIHFSPAWRP